MLGIKQRISFIYSTVSGEIPLDIIGYIGSIFWISGTFGPRIVNPELAPFVGDYTQLIAPGDLSAGFISLALFTHLLFPLLYILYAGPFKVRADWYPLATDSKVHRAKDRGELKLESGGKLDIVVPVEVIESARSYKLEFGSTVPLEIEMFDEPNNDQNWDREEQVLSSQEIEHHTFTPVFTVRATNDLGTGGNHHIRIVDIRPVNLPVLGNIWNRRKKVLRSDVVE